MGKINVNSIFYLIQYIQLLVEHVNDMKIITEIFLFLF